MNNSVGDYFGFPKVKWLYLTGKVDNCVRYFCRMTNYELLR